MAEPQANTGAPKEKPGRFFAAKQLLLFAVMTIAVLAVDFFLLVGMSAFELNEQLAWDGDNSQHNYVKASEVADCLSQNADGTWALAEDSNSTCPNIQSNLIAAGCWAALLNPDGTVAWSFNTPEGFPASFTQNQVAVMSHDREFEGATTFIWTKDPYLVVLGYPGQQYTSFGITMEESSLYRIPLYLLLFFVVDLAIIFLLYTFSQRSILKNIEPTLHALDSLAEGKPVQVRFGGLLRPIGTRINQVSRTLEHKETARKNWIAGVSHDVRTPLAVVMGHAERLEHDPALPAPQQNTAATIVQQSMRIRDLVKDLNIATQLEYDMQPLEISPIPMARLMRTTAANYLNQGLAEDATIELAIADDAADVSFPSDERLMQRALSNAINNALKHNSYTCVVELGLCRTSNGFALSVSDNGQGIAPEKLTALAHMLEEDYLGKGSLTQLSSTSFTFAASASELGPLQNSAVGAPEAPAATEGRAYPQGYTAPTIKTWGRARKSAGAKPIPPAEREAQRASGVQGEKQNPALHSGAQDSGTALAPTPSPAPDAPQSTDVHHVSIGQHGLGMPLIARIVLVHGGTFTVESAPGAGFRIVMAFPL